MVSKYLIHACPDRMWYVNDYIIPSLQSQGINSSAIDVGCDYDHLGCLEKCMEIFRYMVGNGATWHLQDDIIVSRDFRERTEKLVTNDKVICGFSSQMDRNRNLVGVTKPENMWWSFPCVMIPDSLARECAEWYYSFARGYAKYWEWVHMGKCDDNFFREFLLKKHPDIDVMNLSPNLVDHVDYLIGGSMVNTYRGDVRIVSNNFADKDLVDELSKKLESK